MEFKKIAKTIRPELLTYLWGLIIGMGMMRAHGAGLNTLFFIILIGSFVYVFMVVILDKAQETKKKKQEIEFIPRR